MTNTEQFDALPLRQRKFATTKLGLLHAAMNAIRTRQLEQVTVQELCGTVSISEASFFNYFPRKTDLLIYYIQLWSIEMAWHSRHSHEKSVGNGGIAAIEHVFALTARRVAANPGLMGEIVAAQARMDEAPRFAEITVAEKLLAFPALDGVDRVDASGLESLLPPLIERAIKARELPRRTDRSAALVALAAVFLGLPVVLTRANSGALEKAYQQQLQLVWAGLRAKK